jgi:hypothetical protein
MLTFAPSILTLLSVVPACAPESGDADGDGVPDGDDCGPLDPAIHPGAADVCDALDNDCDGVVDGPGATDALQLFTDADGDGFGAGAPIAACEAGPGLVPDDSDCGDTDSSAHPGGPEFCDGHDNDCDGDTDEEDAVDAASWHPDADGDGLGSAAVGEIACSAPAGFLADASDCDDSVAEVNPTAVEVCGNLRDDNCDGGPNQCQGFGGMMNYEKADAVIIRDECSVGAAAFAGDVDGDGTGDMIFGGYTCGDGMAYLITGPWAGVRYQSLDTTARFVGHTPGGRAGYSVDGAGDVNGDGYADVVIGAPGDWNSSDADRVGAYIFYGPVEGTWSLAEADARIETTFASTAAGRCVSGVGDVTGDGLDDIAVGGGAGWQAAPTLHVLSAPLAGDVSLDSAGFGITGHGVQCAFGLGDVSGDGVSDLLVEAAAYLVDPLGSLGGDRAGRVYTVAGPIGSSFWLDETSARLTIDGGVCHWEFLEVYDAGRSAGDVTQSPGDLDGDGTNDIALQAYECVPVPENRGWGKWRGNISTYVFRGQRSGVVSVDEADGLMSGASLVEPGDYNGDGAVDSVMYAISGQDPYDVVYGPLVGAPGPTDAAQFERGNGGPFRAPSDDLNADGYDDLVVSGVYPPAGEHAVGWLIYFGGPGW